MDSWARKKRKGEKIVLQNEWVMFELLIIKYSKFTKIESVVRDEKLNWVVKIVLWHYSLANLTKN